MSSIVSSPLSSTRTSCSAEVIFVPATVPPTGMPLMTTHLTSLPSPVVW